MFASLFTVLDNWQYYLASPLWLVVIIFQIWMFIHAVRNGEWFWAIFIWLFPGLNAILYFFLVYRASPASMQGFELPGARSRARIKELEAQIHHLDNAYHHFQLGDVYFRKGKLAQAEKCYRAALERDSKDIDARAHLGQCLVRMNRPAEARPILESVMHEKPDHDYGHTMMALAEALTMLGETDNALQYWQHITQNHSYPRAKVQLAELYLAKGKPDLARAEARTVLSDDAYAPAFQRRRDRVWIRRAKGLLAKVK